MSAPEAPPFPPVKNIPPVVETTPGGKFPDSLPVTKAMIEKYGPKKANHLTPEELWAMSPAERADYLKTMREEAAKESTEAAAAAVQAVEEAANQNNAAANRRVLDPNAPAPEAPPFPPVENIPPVIETAPGAKAPAQYPVTKAMTEKYGPKGPNHRTPEELWELEKERKEKEAKEAEEREAAEAEAAEGAAGGEGVTTDVTQLAPAVGEAAEAAGPTSNRRVLDPNEPAPDAPPFPPVENIPPVIETAPGAKLPSERAVTVAMTEKYGPKGPNHRTPEELWALAKESAAQTAADTAQQVATNAAAAPAVKAAPTPAAVSAPYVPEAPRPQYMPPVIETAPGAKLPSQTAMTKAMTEKYGPKVPNRLTPAELELKAGYRSKMPPVQQTLAERRAAATAAAAAAAAEAEGGQAAAAATAGTAAAGAPVTSGKSAAAVPAAATPTKAEAESATATSGKSDGQTAAGAGGAGGAGGAAPAKTGAQGATAPGASPSSAPAATAAPSATRGADSVATAGGGGAAPAAGAAAPSMVSKASAVATSLMQNKIFMSAFAVGAAALTVFSIYKGVELYNRYCLNQAITDVQTRELQTVHLYIHHRSPLSPSISIPCTRIETYLRVAKIPYEAHCISDPAVSPNGHLPFIVYDNQRIAGPQAIIDFLSSTFNVFLDDRLTDDQYATGVAVMKALEYSLVRGYMRSIHVEKPELIRPYYSEMHHTPDFITRIALSRLRADIERTNDTSGYNRLTTEQYQFELAKDAKAIETLLSRHEFLFSDEYPSSFDCALYAWLLPIVAMEDAAEVNAVFEYIVASESLTNFVKRMTELAFPDLDELVLSALEGEKAQLEAYSEAPPSRNTSHHSVRTRDEQSSQKGGARPQRSRRDSMSQRRQDLSRGDGRSLSNSTTPRPSASVPQ